MSLFTRTCPRDRADLVERRVPAFGMRVDECPRCRGLYLEGRGVENLCGAQNLDARLRRIPARTPVVGPCPACANPLARSAGPNVEVDRCFACNGVWIDAAEFERLALRDRAFTVGERSPLHRGLDQLARALGSPATLSQPSSSFTASGVASTDET